MFCFYDKLKDVVTGYEGVVTCVVHDLGSICRYGLQAAIKDDKIPEVFSFDEAKLELVEEGKNRRPATEVYAYGFKDIVSDTLTGIEGMVVSRSEFLNGCLRYGVQIQYKPKSNKIPPLHYAYEQSLKLVTKSTAPEVKKTGGPIGGVAAAVKDQF